MVTDRDLRIFEYLYTYLKLDFDQLSYLEKVSPANRKRLRQRLLTLSRAGCIHTFTGSLGKPPIFALLDKGIDIYLRSKIQDEDSSDFKPRRITRPRHKDAEKIRRHEIGISELAMIQAHAAAADPTGFFVCHRDIFQTASESAIRSLHKWPVPVEWQDEMNAFWLAPDFLAGTGFSNRPEGKNVRFFSYEIDCSSETQKPNTPLARGQSILRKLLTYEVTIEQDLLKEFLGIDYLTPLFVFETEKRRDNAVELAQEVLSSRRVKGQILFGLRPERPTASSVPDFAALPWINGHGKETRVRL